MGCSLFSNSHFQMGVTVMGFAEQFGHSILEKEVIDRQFSKCFVKKMFTLSNKSVAPNKAMPKVPCKPHYGNYHLEMGV